MGTRIGVRWLSTLFVAAAAVITSCFLRRRWQQHSRPTRRLRRDGRQRHQCVHEQRCRDQELRAEDVRPARVHVRHERRRVRRHPRLRRVPHGPVLRRRRLQPVRRQHRRCLTAATAARRPAARRRPARASTSTCGYAGDGCGGVLNCGTCTSPQFCGGGGHNKCGGNNGLARRRRQAAARARPRRAPRSAYTCGVAADGCGGVLNCGTCTNPQFCGGGGFDQCGGNNGLLPDGGIPCTPTTCAALGYTCGVAADGCGGVLNCGTCTDPQYCGGGGYSKCGGNNGLTPDGGVACTPRPAAASATRAASPATAAAGRSAAARAPTRSTAAAAATTSAAATTASRPTAASPARPRPARSSATPAASPATAAAARSTAARARTRSTAAAAASTCAAATTASRPTAASPARRRRARPRLQLRPGGRRLRRPPQLRHLHQSPVLRRRRLRPVRRQQRPHGRRRRRLHAEDLRAARLHLRRGGRRLRQPAQLRHVHLAAVLRRRRVRRVRADHRLRVRRRRDDQRHRLRLRPGQQPARLQRARLRPGRRRPDAADGRQPGDLRLHRAAGVRLGVHRHRRQLHAERAERLEPHARRPARQVAARVHRDDHAVQGEQARWNT